MAAAGPAPAAFPPWRALAQEVSVAGAAPDALLEALGVLDTPPEQRFDDLTELACKMLRGDAAYVSLVDRSRKRIFYKSAHIAPHAVGRLNGEDLPLQDGMPFFCVKTADTCAANVVPDATADPVWRTCPVVECVGIRSYTGYPLEVSPGVAVGSLCVISFTPLAVEPDAVLPGLAALARQVVSQLQLGLALSCVAATNAQLVNTIQQRDAAEAARLQLAACADAKKREIVSAVSHELRTPLLAVSGAAELLSACVPGEGEAAELVAMLQVGAARMGTLLEDVLDFGAASTGKLRINAAPFDVQAALLGPLRRTLDCAAASAAAAAASASGGGAAAHGASLFASKLSHVHITFQLDPRVPRVLVGDIMRLTQAVKCTPEGGAITLRLDFAPGTQAPGRLVLSVRDTGIGLAAEQIEAVFQPFVQAEGDAHSHYGGTGLGLAICRRIATAMGGELSVSSDGPGCGATFTLVAPAEVAPSSAASSEAQASPAAARQKRSSHPEEVASSGEAALRAAARPRCTSTLEVLPAVAAHAAPAPPAPAAADAPQLRVLVADDDALCRTVVGATARRLGASVVLVPTGAAAVSAFAEARGAFDLVMLDYHMGPEMDGPTAAINITRMAALYGNLPRICVLTGDIEEAATEAILSAGAACKLLKPITMDALAAQMGAAREAAAAHRA